MAKYIVDLPKEYTSKSSLLGEILSIPIQIDDGKNYNIPTAIKITPYTEPDNKAAEDEVWNFARRIICPSDCCEDSISKYTKKFLGIPSHKTRAIFKDLSYQEVKARYEKWRQKEEIRVGDELKQVAANGRPTGLKCVVVEIDDDKMRGIGRDGNMVVCSSQVKTWWHKTGRHFNEVAELLKKMRGELNHENKL